VLRGETVFLWKGSASPFGARRGSSCGVVEAMNKYIVGMKLGVLLGRIYRIGRAENANVFFWKNNKLRIYFHYRSQAREKYIDYIQPIRPSTSRKRGCRGERKEKWGCRTQ
jgi:hypothetical protein